MKVEICIESNEIIGHRNFLEVVNGKVFINQEDRIVLILDGNSGLAYCIHYY